MSKVLNVGREMAVNNKRMKAQKRMALGMEFANPAILVLVTTTAQRGKRGIGTLEWCAYGESPSKFKQLRALNPGCLHRIQIFIWIPFSSEYHKLSLLHRVSMFVRCLFSPN